MRTKRHPHRENQGKPGAHQAGFAGFFLEMSPTKKKRAAVLKRLIQIIKRDPMFWGNISTRSVATINAPLPIYL